MCTDCPNGTYNDKTGQSTCVNCPIDTSNYSVKNTSSESCKTCPAGKKCYQGITCPDGQYIYRYYQQGNPNEIVKCANCPAGKFSINSNDCTTCEPNKWSAEGSSSCQPNSECPEGSYCSNGLKTPCPPNKWSPKGSTSESQCVDCPPGNKCSNGVKTISPGGWAYAGGSNITYCKPGSIEFAPAGSTRCFKCYSLGALQYDGTNSIGCKLLPLEASCASSASCGTNCCAGTWGGLGPSYCVDSSYTTYGKCDETKRDW